MSPVYEEGDFIITFSRSNYKHGDDIVFNDSIFGLMIKRISYRTVDGWFVNGTNQHTLSSEQFGTVRKDQIIGKVVFHIKNKKRQTLEASG